MNKMRKEKIGQGIATGATLAVVGALAFGGFALFNGAGANADASTTQASVSVTTTIGPEADGPERDAQARAAAQAVAEAAAVAQQQAEAAAAAQAAADAQAAANAAAAKKVATKSAAGPVKCPAGSQANSNDGVNDTSCFPTKCFTMVVDPSDPEAAACLAPFKP